MTPGAERVRKWRERNRDRVEKYEQGRKVEKAATTRRSQLRIRYGLACEQYAQMLAVQGGVCAICARESADGRRLSVDHDHQTGRVRALLCTNCNHGLGKFKDDPALLRQAAEYLDGHA